MSVIRYHIKQGDLTTPVEAILRDKNTKRPVDLTDADGVVFRMRLAEDEDAPVISGDCTIGDPPTSGAARYDWDTGQTDDPGVYEFEFAVRRGSDLQTVPSEGYGLLRIWPTLQ